MLFAACHTGGLAASRFVYYDIIIFIRRGKKDIERSHVELTGDTLVTHQYNFSFHIIVKY